MTRIEPCGDVFLGPLRSVLTPIGPGDPDAGGEERKKNYGQEQADTARAMLVGVSGHEQPSIDKWIDAHRKLPLAGTEA